MTTYEFWDSSWWGYDGVYVDRYVRASWLYLRGTAVVKYCVLISDFASSLLPQLENNNSTFFLKLFISILILELVVRWNEYKKRILLFLEVRMRRFEILISVFFTWS